MRHDSHAFVKSILSVLLSFAMVFDAVPTAALAAAMPMGDGVTCVSPGEGASSSDDVSYTESDEGLRALVVDGGAKLSDKALAKRLVDDGLDEDGADDVVYELKAARAPRRDGGDEDLPRSGDGSNVEMFALSWQTLDTVDNDDALDLYLRPDTDEPFSVRLRLNYALSGEHAYNAGDIRITFPKELFVDRNGNSIGTFSLPYPEAPSRAQDFNWELVDGNYVLTNTKRLSAATKGFMEFEVSNLVPHVIDDMAASGNFPAKIEVTTFAGNLIGLVADPLVCHVDTEQRITAAYKASPYYMEPQWVSADEIPEDQRIEGVDEYLVVTWNVYASHAGNTEFTVTAKDVLVDDEYGGFILGDASFDGTGERDFGEVFSGWSRYSVGNMQVRVAYPADQFAPDVDYKFRNRIEYELTEMDGEKENDPQLVTTAAATGELNFRWHTPEFERPRGHFMHSKFGNDGARDKRPYWSHTNTMYDLDVSGRFHNTSSAYGIYESALNELRDGTSVELGYTVEPQAWIAPWQLADGADPMLIGSYSEPVHEVVTDEGSLPLSLSGGEVLECGVDWDYVGIEFPQRPYIAKLRAVNINPDGSFTAEHMGDGTFEYMDDTDYSHQPTFFVEAFVGDEWRQIGMVSWATGSRVIVPSGGALVDGARIIVPSGTRQIRIQTTFANAAMYYYCRPIVRLHPTEKVLSCVDQAFAASFAPSVWAYNTSGMTVFDHSGAQIFDMDVRGRDKLMGYSEDVRVVPNKSLRQQASDVDYERRQVNLHYSVTIDEQSFVLDNDTWNMAVEEGRIEVDRHGRFYDLLPQGVTPILSTVRLRGGDKVLDAYTVENWRDSGRTMLVVEAELAPKLGTWSLDEELYSGVTRVKDTPTLTFDAIYGFDAIIDYGSDLHNVVAYEALDVSQLGSVDGYRGEADDPYGTNNVKTAGAFEDDAERDLMAGLDESREGDCFVYAGITSHLNVLAAARTSLSKDVQVNRDGRWSQGTYDDVCTVYEGGVYDYRLRMMSDTDTMTRNIILFDTLENYHAVEGNDPNDVGAPRWRGVLRSIDLTQIREMGVDPVVYYSTVDELELSDETNPMEAHPTNVNVGNTDVWVRAEDYGGPMEAVHAIAIDCSMGADDEPFVLDEMQSLVAIVHMQAPSGDAARTYISQKGVWGDSAQAYNNAYMTCGSYDKTTGIGDDSSFVRNDYTKVGLMEYKYAVSKVWSDDNDRDGMRPDELVVHLLANRQDTGMTQTLSEDNGWSASFDNIPYTTPDGEVIRYSVEEDDVEGYVPSSAIGDNSVTLTNSHMPETISVSGTKTWVCDDESAIPESVKVTLLADGVEKASRIVRANDDGEWTYSFDGLPKYRDHGVLVDYAVRETVTDVRFLSAVDGFDMTNTYHPYGDVSLTKSVQGATEAYRDREFPVTFMLLGEDGSPVFGSWQWTSTTGRTGTVSSGATLSVRDGETITIHELPHDADYEFIEADVPGYVMSGTGLAGSVVANTTLSADIVNTYDASGTATLRATKELTGRDMGRYDFKFELVDDEGNVVRSGSNQASGSVTFGALSYGLADAGHSFHYTIRETNRAWGGYSYDDAEYGVTVDVSDNGDGTLACDVRYFDENGDPVDVPEFENTYEAHGSIRLRAWKRLRGASLGDGDFTFQFLRADGTQFCEKTNDANGDVYSDLIEFDETTAGGTELYVVREVAGDDEHVTYDDSVFGYVVSSEDNGRGQVLCTQTYVPVRFDEGEGKWVIDDEGEAASPVFVNRMKPGELTIRKQTVGDVPEANAHDEFRFKVQLVGEDIPESIEYDVHRIGGQDGPDNPAPTGTVTCDNVVSRFVDWLLAPRVAYAADGGDDASEFVTHLHANGGHFGTDASDVDHDITWRSTNVGDMVAVSHTANISDSGVKSGNYPNNASNSYIRGTGRAGASNDAHVVTIPGARRLKVTIEYGGESTSYDWVRVWKGSHPEYTASTAITQDLVVSKLGGAHGRATYEVDGDSLTFAFVSDTSQCGDGYGYYAQVEATVACVSDDDVSNPVWDGHAFTGWNTAADGSGTDVDNTYAGDIYAQWTDQVVMFDANGGTFTSNGLDTLCVEKNPNGGTFGNAWSKTSNVDDHGRFTSAYYSGYASNTSTLSTVSIPGAKKLGIDYRRAKSYYYDRFYIIGGEYTTPLTSSNTSVPGQIYHSGQGTMAEGTYTYSYNGDTVTFGLWRQNGSSTSGSNYQLGWYAKVSAKDTVVAGDVVEVPVNGHKEFVGWNTEPDGTGDWYSDGSVMMYAQWNDFGGTCGGVSYAVMGDTLYFWPTNGVSGTFERPENGQWPWWNLLDYGNNVKNIIFEEGVVACEDMSYAFHRDNSTAGNMRLSYIDARNLDTSGLKNASYMFCYLTNLSLVDLSTWDTQSLENASGMFQGDTYLSSIHGIDSLDMSHVTNMRSMFASCTNLTIDDLTDWDVGSVRDMSSMFYNCPYMTGIDLSGWDVSNVENFSGMFQMGARLAKGLDTWHPTSAKNMANMFASSSVYADALSGWEVGTVESMSGMFDNAMFYEDDGTTQASELDLGDWDVSHVTNMSSMFRSTSSSYLPCEILMDNWDTGSVTDMSLMFYGGSSVVNKRYCDLSKLDVRNVTNFSSMFVGNRMFKTIDISTWDMSSATNTATMIGSSYNGASYNQEVGTSKLIIGERCKFVQSNSLLYSGQSTDGRWHKLGEPATTTLAGSEVVALQTSDHDRFVGTWATGNQTAVAVLQEDGTMVFVVPDDTVDLPDDESQVVTVRSVGGTEYTGYVDVDWVANSNGTRAFFDAERRATIREIYVDPDSTVKMLYPQGLSQLFNGLTNLETFDGTGFDTSNETSLYRTFYGCSKLRSVNLEGWDTTHVVGAQEMFCGDVLLEDFGMDQIDTSAVQNMSGMFQNCDKLVASELEGFETDAATNMSNMFYDADLLESPDLSGFDMSHVTTTYRMFYSCDKIGDLDLSDWDVHVVTNMGEMFSGSGLRTIDAHGWDAAATTSMYRMFYGCSRLTSVDMGDWNTPALTGVSGMFYGCSQLEQLDVSDLDVGRVTSFGSTTSSYDGMFAYCSKLRSLDLSDWDFGGLSGSVGYMFYNCSSLESLDISSMVNMHRNVSRSYMFNNCPKLRSVTLGDDFEFASDAYLDNPSMSNAYYYYALLPTPPSATTTGKWVNLEKDENSALTPVELRDTYDGTDESMVGTWVWQMSQQKFVFDGNEGVGSMSAYIVAKGTTGTLPACTFTLFDHDFVGWNTEPDGSGQGYDDGATIRVTGSENRTIRLYAQWQQRDHSVDIEDGSFYVTIPADCELTISNLPAGVGYVITEVGSTQRGWTQASAENTAGTIDALGEDVSIFGNSYTPDVAQATIVSSKTMEGAAVDAGQFEFQLVELATDSETGDVSESVVQTVANSDGGGVLFEPMSYTEVGEHRYLIREVEGADETVDYDDSEHGVTVSVMRDADDILMATVSYDDDAVPRFANELKRDSLVVTKVTSGCREDEADDVFSAVVSLTDVHGEPVTSVVIDDEERTSDDGTYVLGLHEGSEVLVSGIPVGTTYSVEETDIPGGWSLDEAGSSLSGTVTVNGGATATISNVYSATGEVTLQAWKRLSGRTPVSGEFAFELLDEGGERIDVANNSAVDNRDLILGEDGETMVANPHRGYAPVTFGSIAYDEPGTYRYTIRELAGDDVSVDYDTSEVHVTVDVFDVGGGNLECEVTYDDDDWLFENVVVPGALSLEKHVTGATEAAMSAEFTYHVSLRDASGAAVPDATYEATRNGVPIELSCEGGVIDVPMSADDVVIVEGVAHDTRYTVFEDMEACWSKVSESGTSGTIAREVTSVASITNAYDASGSFSLAATKRCDGFDLEAGAFTFKVLDADGVEVARAVNDEAGLVSFGTIDVGLRDLGSDLTYTISEVAGENARIAYDGHVETVTVTLVDDGHGHITATPSYDADGATFSNVDNPGHLMVAKHSVIPELLEDEEKFSLADAVFEVYDSDGHLVGTLVTNGEGLTEVLELDPGTYYVKETVAPMGFVLDVTRHAVTVVGGQTTTANVVDEPECGSIEIVKVPDRPEMVAGNADYSLAGAVYGIYASEEDALSAQSGVEVEAVGTIVTEQVGDHGHGICEDIETGTYWVVELVAPAHYAVDATIYEVSVTAGTTVAVGDDGVIVEHAVGGHLNLEKVLAL